MDGSEENTPCNTPARQAVTPDEKTLMSSKRYHAVLHRTLEASAAATCDTESLRAAALRAQVAGLRAELETARAQAVSLSTKVEAAHAANLGAQLGAAQAALAAKEAQVEQLGRDLAAARDEHERAQRGAKVVHAMLADRELRTFEEEQAETRLAAAHVAGAAVHNAVCADFRREPAEKLAAAKDKAAHLTVQAGAAAVKCRRLVDEIRKVVNWAQSTTPLPPILGGRTSPAAFSSLLGGRLSFAGGSAGASMAAAAAAAVAASSPLPSPLGDATNQLGSHGNRATPLSASPSKHQLQVGSPAGRTPIASPTKMR